MSTTVLRDKVWITVCWENQPAEKTRNYYFNGGETVIEHIRTSTFSRARIVKNVIINMEFPKMEGVSYENLPPVVRRCYERQYSNA